MDGNPVVIIGSGGFARETLEILKEQNFQASCINIEYWDILGFIDENKELYGSVIHGYPVLGGLDWFDVHDEVKSMQATMERKITDNRKQVMSKRIGKNRINSDLNPSSPGYM